MIDHCQLLGAHMSVVSLETTQKSTFPSRLEWLEVGVSFIVIKIDGTS